MPENEAANRRERQAEARENQADVRQNQAEVREVVVEKQQNVLHGYLKVILWVAAILFILAVLSLIRTFQLESAVDTLDEHTIDLTTETNAAKEAAVDARDTLQAALNEAEVRRSETSGSSPTAIRDALLAIARIETHLCGGPCDGGG